MSGDITLGLPAIDENGKSRWGVWDCDKDNDSLDKIQGWLQSHGWRSHREGKRPGRAGHLWIFFDEPVPAADLRLFANRVQELAGVRASEFDAFFPKQDKPNWDAQHARFTASSLVRLPLGVHRKPEAMGERGWFDDVEPVVSSQVLWLMCLILNPIAPLLEAAPTLRKLAMAKAGTTHSLYPRAPVSPEEEQRITTALARISPDDYQTWLKVGMALRSAGLSQAVWDAWSRRSPKYAPRDCIQKWATFSGVGKIGLGTLYYLANRTQ